MDFIACKHESGSRWAPKRAGSVGAVASIADVIQALERCCFVVCAHSKFDKNEWSACHHLVSSNFQKK